VLALECGVVETASAQLDCFGQAPTAGCRVNGTIGPCVGTSGDDRIRGTNGDDVILGLEENDRIAGRDGNDRICAGDGNDKVRGGRDHDKIDGGAGNDNISGDGGNDELYGGADDDILKGGRDNDIVDGGLGNDVLSGNSGSDTMSGWSGNDSLMGGAAVDFCVAASPQKGCEVLSDCALSIAGACDPNAQCVDNGGGILECICDAGYTYDGLTCATACGDGVIAGDETCDDGLDDGIGCASGCDTVNTTGGAATGFNCVVAEGDVPNSFCFEPGGMIPLRSCRYRLHDYCVRLTGSAIYGAPVEINFDTGSWTTSIPDGCVNSNQVQVLQANTTDDWGIPADKVKGQLALVSSDGSTTYQTDSNYVFFARKNVACDRASDYDAAIMGALPGSYPYSNLTSLPYQLALDHAASNPGSDTGLGIISFAEGDIRENWSSFKSYLQIGPDSSLISDLNWRTDIPLFPGRVNFSPEAIPGFEVTVAPGTTSEAVFSNLWATIDTGAPELNTRLGPTDPHVNGPLANLTIDCSARFSWLPSYARCLQKDVEVRIKFTDSNGVSNAYEFPAGVDPSPSNDVILGTWAGTVPWAVDSEKPETRINLGNTVYFYSPVYFWDVTNKRVGLRIR
jgi:hypothetical protein